MNQPKPQMSIPAQIARLEKALGQLLKMRQNEANAADMAVTAPDRMHNNLNKNLPPALRPLNVGEYSSVVWSYFFPLMSGIIAPNTALDVLTSITQEAAFIMTHMYAVAYEYTSVLGVNKYTRVENLDVLPLKLTLVDAQSNRQFMNAPEPISLFGTPEIPRKLPTPSFYLPTSTVVTRIQNDSPTKSYQVCFVLLGARVRIDDAQNIRGTLVG